MDRSPPPAPDSDRPSDAAPEASGSRSASASEAKQASQAVAPGANAANSANGAAGGAGGGSIRSRARLGDLLAHFERLLNADLGDSPTRSMEALSYLVRLTRETIKELARARCFLRASALAYSTILSLVPLLAMVMALLSMPALASHQERVINSIVDSLTPGVDEDKTWGQKGVQRYIRVTIRTVGGQNKEIIGQQLAGRAYPTNPTGDEPILIKREIPLTADPKDEPPPPPLPAGGAPVHLESKFAPRRYFWTTVDRLQPVYSDGDAGDRIRVVGLDDQGQRKAEVYTYLGNFTSKAGAVGLIGFVLLMYIVYSMLSRIENTFSEIWGVRRRRNFFQRVSLYTALVFWGPIVLIAASAGLEFMAHLEVVTRLGFIGPLMLRLIGLAITAMVLTSAYIILPNAGVRFRPACTGGLMAAVLWVLASYGFSSYIAMTGGGSYQKVYGTLGLLPMILILIYMSWVILLFGAVVSFTIQNFGDLDRKSLLQHRAEETQVYMALRLCVEIVRAFRAGAGGETGASGETGAAGVVSGAAPGTARGERPAGWRRLFHRRPAGARTPQQIVAAEIEVPPYAVEAIAEKLVAARLLCEAADQPGRLMPARDPDTIAVYEVLTAIRPKLTAIPARSTHPERDAIAGVIRSVAKAEVERLEGLTLGQLTRRLDAHLRGESAAADRPVGMAALDAALAEGA
ncbi:MAG: YihY/virulence factor BrkB family protein [Planctomycetota bacterium]